MTNQPNKPGRLLEFAVKQRDLIAYVALAVGAIHLLTIILALDVSGQHGDQVAAAIWSGLLAVVFIAGGAVLAVRQPAAGREVVEVRVWLISVGGAAGLLTALLGFAFAWMWQDSIFQWINDGRVREARWVLAAAGIFISGLAFMFFSMQPARAEERTSLLLRRLLYGTNAALTGLLLLLVLTVVNVFVSLKLPDNVITTAAAFKGLSSRGKEFLRSIQEDVTIYLIMPENHAFRIQRDDTYNSLYADCRALLNACAAENPHIKVVPLLPATDDDKIKDLMKRLKVPENDRENFGLLIEYGRGDDLSSFIDWRALFRSNPQGAPVFQGENQLLTELNFLSGGARRPVVYFTQSNLEPSIDTTAAGDRGRPTCRELVEHLRERKFDVKPLLFEPGRKPDLADATMVVIAAPQAPFSVEQTAILREFMTPRKGKAQGGKLVALLPTFPTLDAHVSETGLEALLVQFGVNAEPRQKIFTFPRGQAPQRIPTDLVLGGLAFEILRAGLVPARLIDPNQGYFFSNVRPVWAAERQPVENVQAFNLFSTKRFLTYRDDKVVSDTKAIKAKIEEEGEKNIIKLAQEKQVTDGPVPFGVYVAEPVRDGSQVKERPRLVVIGSDCFIADDSAKQINLPIPRPEYIALIANILEVVRERPSGMGIEPQTLGAFSIPDNADNAGLRFLPVGLVLLGIVALGVGVWFARRS